MIIDEFISVKDWEADDMTKKLMVEISELRDTAMNCLLLVNASVEPCTVTRLQERISMCDRILNFHNKVYEELNKKEQDNGE